MAAPVSAQALSYCSQLRFLGRCQSATEGVPIRAGARVPPRQSPQPPPLPPLQGTQSHRREKNSSSWVLRPGALSFLPSVPPPIPKSSFFPPLHLLPAPPQLIFGAFHSLFQPLPSSHRRIRLLAQSITMAEEVRSVPPPWFVARVSLCADALRPQKHHPALDSCPTTGTSFAHSFRRGPGRHATCLQRHRRLAESSPVHPRARIFWMRLMPALLS